MAAVRGVAAEAPVVSLPHKVVADGSLWKNGDPPPEVLDLTFPSVPMVVLISDHRLVRVLT